MTRQRLHHLHGWTLTEKILVIGLFTIAVLLFAAGLAGCGSAQHHPAATASAAATASVSAEASAPACSTLVGHPVPANFAGCTEHATLYGWVSIDCADGSSFVIVGENPGYFGRTGHGVMASGDTSHAAAGTPYGNAQQACYAGR